MSSIIRAFGGLAFLGLLLALWFVLSSATPQVASAVIAAVATVLVAVFGALATRQREHERDVQQAQRKQKIEVYQEFLDYWFKAMRGSRDKLSDAAKKKFDDQYYTTVPKQLVTWASEPVLVQVADFMDQTAPKHKRDLLALEEIVLSIRSDLGYRNEGLRQGDILRVFNQQGVEQLLRERNYPTES